jgi:Peptidase family C25
LGQNGSTGYNTKKRRIRFHPSKNDLQNMQFFLRLTTFWLLLLLTNGLSAQGYSFNFGSSGQRVCHATTTIDLIGPTATIHLLDASDNSDKPTSIYRRPLNGSGNDWVLRVSGLPPGTATWVDTELTYGDVWEYQIVRADSWNFEGQLYPAVGYAAAAIRYDRSLPQGSMILLVADNVATQLADEVERLRMDLTGDGWYVNLLVVPADDDWDGGTAAVGIKQQITDLYNAASADAKPSHLFILGHVPMPRSGSTEAAAPDEHNENKGARGADAFYADLDGNFTDVATYNPGGLATPLAVNVPGDARWDQDYIPSELEMAFGRVDFRDLSDVSDSEITLTRRYLDRLHAYRHVVPGHFMGQRTAFHFGYDNSNDGAYRSLPSISLPDSIQQNYAGAPHPSWVKTNGPFMLYMQNVSVPEIGEWLTDGMDATVYGSDQSYWGWGDVPQAGSIYSRIRSLLAVESKCLVTLWNTTGVSMYHQPGTGETMGFSCKQIMDHNASNQKLPKPPQAYDTPEWWNRTHFAYHGDPTLRLHQVVPPTDLTAQVSEFGTTLSWNYSLDSRLPDYHVYQSTSGVWGPYVRLTDTPIAANSYNTSDVTGGQWYLVRAVLDQTTGSGIFINPSQGIMASSAVSTSEPTLTTCTLRPNPTRGDFQINASMPWRTAILRNALGVEVRHYSYGEATSLSNLPDGMYSVEVFFEEKKAVQTLRLVKS